MVIPKIDVIMKKKWQNKLSSVISQKLSDSSRFFMVKLSFLGNYSKNWVIRGNYREIRMILHNVQ